MSGETELDVTFGKFLYALEQLRTVRGIFTLESLSKQQAVSQAEREARDAFHKAVHAAIKQPLSE